MDGIGEEISQKIRLAIKVKLEEIGLLVDEELPDYVMVMVANKKSKEQMDDDLQLFLGDNTSFFTTWLHHVLQKLQEVTVAKAGGKRKLSEDSKKKKKSKLEVDKKSVVPKKKIKVEPGVDLGKESTTLSKPVESQPELSNQDKIIEDAGKPAETPVSNESKESKNNTKTVKLRRDSNTRSTSLKQSTEGFPDHMSSSQSASSHLEDLDDEDFINIRTDGELLDAAEDINVDDTSKKSKEKEKERNSSSKSKNRVREKDLSSPEPKSPPMENIKSKPSEVDKTVKNLTAKTHTSPKSVKTPPKTESKLVDARELLNRKKAARLAQNRSKTRSRSRDRSKSPQRKKRDERDTSFKNYSSDRTGNKKREDEREADRRINRDKNVRDRERDVRGEDFYSARKRMEDRFHRRSDSDRIDTRERRRESSNEPLKRNFNQRYESRKRSSKDDYDDCEEPVKRGGLVSRVVAREPSPESEVDTPIPSVVKVTPRPRRPPSQQPSSTLIMKAISDANKSLASAPPRPDSTQRPRKEPVLARKLRNRVRVPPEQISISIRNPLAVQIVENSEIKEDDEGPPSPKYDPSAVNRSPPPELLRPSLDLGIVGQGNEEDEKSDKEEEWEEEEKMEVYEEEPEEQEPKEAEKVEKVLQPKPVNPVDELMEEMSDPQFVVTLNGYDPDGLFSQCDEDEAEEEGDSWFKRGHEPLLTSTQAEAMSPPPQQQQQSSPPLLMAAPAVNHSNLIEVEVVKMISERCKYWPACRLGDKCTYYHPSKPCNTFPNCKFGDSCLFIHPQCKFNALCTRKDCIFAHTTAHSSLQTTVLPKPVYSSTSQVLCKFYPNCININCPFTHSSKVCKFGLYCTKKDCIFEHGKVAPVDKLKWTRVPST